MRSTSCSAGRISRRSRIGSRICNKLRLVHTPIKPQVGVHKGFYSAYKSIDPLVWGVYRKLKNACTSCNRLVITGHSLGGAMATIAAVEFKRQGVAAELYTLGSPRVGNVGFYTYFAALGMPSTRLVNQHDIVPHLSLQSFGYHHVASELWYHDGAYKSCNQSGEDPSCSDSLLPIEYSISDHTTYLGINLQNGTPGKCNGFIDNQGPPGALKRLMEAA